MYSWESWASSGFSSSGCAFTRATHFWPHSLQCDAKTFNIAQEKIFLRDLDLKSGLHEQNKVN